MINNHESEHGGHKEPRMGEQNTETRDEPMVRKPEMAKRLSVTPRTVENYMRHRRIPFVKNGRLVFFKAREVEAALLRKTEVEPLIHTNKHEKTFRQKNGGQKDGTDI